MKPYYVILTGSKNNAGDYLIKHRAKQLFATLRPDRKIIDIDGWEPFDDERLELVNKAEALIMMGGPALQYHMRPFVYPMVDDLSEIKVPIIMMGVGWYSQVGDWENTQDYYLNNSTKELLKVVSQSGYDSSVRDYHTLNVLLNNGVNNAVMTGCPALYDLEYVNRNPSINNSIDKVVFSLGVGFAHSKGMMETIQNVILALNDFFAKKSFVVAFHHSIDKEKYLKTAHSNPKFFNAQLAFADWLKEKGIEYVDISGSADHLINLYSETDLHIGYRVHAHIFTSSISKPSILITEDGRGKALKKVMNGLIFDSFYSFNNSFIDKVKRKLFKIDRYKVNKDLPKDLIHHLEYELANGSPRLLGQRVNIDGLYPRMEAFLKQLP